MRGAVLALVLLASCEKPAHDSDKPPEDKGVLVESAPPRPDAARKAAPSKPVDLDALRAETTSTGAVACDELIARTLCAYDTAGAAMPAEAKRAFEDGVNAWVAALGEDVTRPPTIEACQVSLEAAMSGFAAQGCGDPDFRKLPAAGGVAVAPDQAPAHLDMTPTGDPTCDKLLERTRCSYDKAGPAMPAEAVKAVDEAVAAWREALKDDATRQATIDACKMSLDAAKDAFAAQGC